MTWFLVSRADPEPAPIAEAIVVNVMARMTIAITASSKEKPLAEM
jgi:hypothetical protein